MNENKNTKNIFYYKGINAWAHIFIYMCVCVFVCMYVLFRFRERNKNRSAKLPNLSLNQILHH